MPNYSKRSRNELATCHPELRSLFNAVIRHYDCTILDGYRSSEDQLKLYEEGKSRVLESKHNQAPSLAVDVAPYPIDWDDTKRFYHFAGFVLGLAAQLGIRLRWGGDWNGDNNLDNQEFFDLVHFELA